MAKVTFRFMIKVKYDTMREGVSCTIGSNSTRLSTISIKSISKKKRNAIVMVS